MPERLIYSWERLPVYECTNQFARLLGRLLVSVPPRFHAATARGLLTELGYALKGSQKETTAGLKLLAAIESSYHSLTALGGGTRPHVPLC